MMRLLPSPLGRPRLPPSLERLRPRSWRTRPEQVGDIELERFGHGVQGHQGGSWRLTALKACERPDAHPSGVGERLLRLLRRVAEVSEVFTEALEQNIVPQRPKQAAAGISFPGCRLPVLHCLNLRAQRRARWRRSRWG